MRRRFFFFGCGVLISIFFLSMGPENRLKKTFFAYIDYFNMDKRVITHLVNDSTSFTTIAECQLVYYNLTKDDEFLISRGPCLAPGLFVVPPSHGTPQIQ